MRSTELASALARPKPAELIAQSHMVIQRSRLVQVTITTCKTSHDIKANWSAPLATIMLRSQLPRSSRSGVDASEHLHAGDLLDLSADSQV